ncbi:glycosyltransferase family 2 protein [Thalassotalea agariperforans]
MISIVFSTYNGNKTLPLMLDSLIGVKEAFSSAWEIIAVNNNSTDNTEAILNHYAKKLPITIINQTTPGKNAALNKALPLIKGSLIIFTDDDVIVPKNWLEQYWNVSEKHSEHDVFGGPIRPYWERSPNPEILTKIPMGIAFAVHSDKLTSSQMSPSNLWGPNMAVRKAVLNKVTFNENIGPRPGSYAMGSETDFLDRVARHGFKAYFDTEITLQHYIRANQITPKWLHGRAYRAGRGALHSDVRNQKFTQYATLLGYPRWLVFKLLKKKINILLKSLTNNEYQLLDKVWDYYYWKGYASEYKIMEKQP